MGNFIEKMEEEVQKQQNKIKQLKTIKEKYPSLKEDKDRWGNIRYYSKEINTEVDNLFIYHGCGCCIDSGVIARPFKEIDNIKIFSDTPGFFVGEGSAIGDVPYTNWENKLIESNIPQSIIQRIKEHFKEQEELYEDEDYDDYDD